MASPLPPRGMDFRSYHRGFAPHPDLRLRFAHGSYAVAQDAVERALRGAAGVALVVGPPGSGKTLLAADIAQRQLVDDIPVARIVAGGADLLRAVAGGFNLQVSRANRGTVMTTLVRYLANRQRDGRTPVVVIDEAQRLEPAALKELWQLGNPRTHAVPLLQLVLAGAPTLVDALQAPPLAALWGAVGAVGELKSLDAPQTRAYIAHRLGCSGWRGTPSLSAEALRCIHRLSAGQPARINLIMERLLRYDTELGSSTLGRADVERIGALLSAAGELTHPDAFASCSRALPPVAPALRPLDAAVTAEFAVVAAAGTPQCAAATLPAGGAGLRPGWSALRDRIAATALRRRLGLVALIGMTVATSALGIGSTADACWSTAPDRLAAGARRDAAAAVPSGLGCSAAGPIIKMPPAPH